MRTRVARRRHALAAGYELVLDDAFGPPRALSPRVPVRRDQVLLAYPEIRRLMALLRDDERPLADAVVRGAWTILCDGASPLYTGPRPLSLRRHLRVLCDTVE
jgi:hypothetical protein